MDSPHALLGLPEGSDSETVRRRYLELVKQFPPEHAPQRFAAIRAAYDALKDPDEVLRTRLFQQDRNASIDALVEEVLCRKLRRRVSLEAMLQTLRTVR